MVSYVLVFVFEWEQHAYAFAQAFEMRLANRRYWWMLFYIDSMKVRNGEIAYRIATFSKHIFRFSGEIDTVLSHRLNKVNSSESKSSHIHQHQESVSGILSSDGETTTSKPNQVRKNHVNIGTTAFKIQGRCRMTLTTAIQKKSIAVQNKWKYHCWQNRWKLSWLNDW